MRRELEPLILDGVAALDGVEGNRRATLAAGRTAALPFTVRRRIPPTR